MKMSEAFPSKFLKATDIPHGREVKLLIDRVQFELMEQSRKEKPVVYFIGKERGLVLNVTNANTLVDAYGDEADKWHNKPVVLFSATTSFQGRNVPCLRVRAMQNGDGNVTADDDCPF